MKRGCLCTSNGERFCLDGFGVRWQQPFCLGRHHTGAGFHFVIPAVFQVVQAAGAHVGGISHSQRATQHVQTTTHFFSRLRHDWRRHVSQELPGRLDECGRTTRSWQGSIILNFATRYFLAVNNQSTPTQLPLTSYVMNKSKFWWDLPCYIWLFQRRCQVGRKWRYPATIWGDYSACRIVSGLTAVSGKNFNNVNNYNHS